MKFLRGRLIVLVPLPRSAGIGSVSSAQAVLGTTLIEAGEEIA
jgi:hypothetical protein